MLGLEEQLTRKRKNKMSWEVRNTGGERPWGLFVTGTDICYGTSVTESAASDFCHRLNSPLIKDEVVKTSNKTE